MSPAASFTHATLVRVRSGVASAAVSTPPVPARRFTLMLTMSASCAANDSTRRPPPPMMSGGAGLLHRARRQRVPDHLVVLTVEVERAVRAQQPLDHLDRLLEPIDADSGSVVGHAGGVVVGALPARTEAELEAARH